MSRVLIVDDEKSIRTTLCEFLKNEGIDAEATGDAASACQMLSEETYDVVLTDIIMPKTSGIDLLATIRNTSTALQVIIMTGEPSVDTAVKAVQTGANDYLTKPISKAILIKAVKNALKVKQLIDEKAMLEEENIYYQKQLEALVEKRTGSLERVTQGIIYLLTSVVEARDPYTAGHQRRVGNLSAAIAETMSLSSETAELIRTIGYVHDIGKICIPAEILSKPGRLSPLEYEMIKIHARKGYEMIIKANLPDTVCNAIYQHHERADGSGYPRGLTDSEICAEAKLLIVADVVEAMVSHRPYRPALGLDTALKEIKLQAGIKYNLDVVDACIRLFESGYTLDDEEKAIHIPL